MRNNIVYTVYIICIFLWIVIPENAMHAASPKKFTVVIDAGHGGHDPGAIGKRGKEKNINLSVALKLGKLIQNNHSDTKVVYTRSSDVFVPFTAGLRLQTKQRPIFSFQSIPTRLLPEAAE